MTAFVRPSLRHRFIALPDHRQGLLAVLGAALLWSTGGLFIKWVSLDAFGVTMWRSLFAAVTIAALNRTGLLRPLRASPLEWCIAVSYAVMLLLFVMATKLTTAANAIFLQYTAPLHVLIWGSLLINERPSRTDVIALAVAFGGMALFFAGRLDADDAAGNLCALGSGAGFALFLTLLRRPGCGPLTRPRAMVLGNLLLVASMVAFNVGRGDWGSFEPGAGDLAGLLFLGVLQIGLAYVLFAHGIARVRVLEASLIGMLEPVLNPVWVFMFLGETPGWWAVAGGTIIVAAVVGRTWAAERGRRVEAAWEASP
jgi:drug/metabolite transporter (DMT)-like permease